MTAMLDVPVLLDNVVVIPPLEPGFVRPKKLTSTLLAERRAQYWVMRDFSLRFPLGLPLTLADLAPHIAFMDVLSLAEATLYPAAARLFGAYKIRLRNAAEYKLMNERLARRYLALMRLYALPVPAGHDCATAELPLASVVPQKVPLRKITTRVLRRLGACPERKFFTKMFPHGLVPTEETAIKAVPVMNMGWAGSVLLDAEGQHVWRVERSRLYGEMRQGIERAFRRFHPRWGENDSAMASMEAYSTEMTRVNRLHEDQLGKLFYRLFKTHPTLVDRYAVAAAYDRRRVMEHYTDEDL